MASSRIFLTMAEYQHFEIRTGRSIVGTRLAVSAREAVLDYLQARGCRRDEISYYGSDAAAWRGAVYRAAPPRVQHSEDEAR